MNLPNREHAYVPDSKLTDYLLSREHVIGRTKAKLFRALGFNEHNLDILKNELIRIAQNEEVRKETRSPHGTKYVIDGELKTPQNKEISITTVWIIEKRKDEPRFVTAYPV